MADSIGARLRSARERSRLTILQAAERLHVDPYILEALEADDFEALGAPVYVKGHLRHYADLVGEPAEGLFEQYSQSARIAPPDLTRIAKAAPPDAGRFVLPAAIVVILVVVAGTVWWALTLWDRQWGPHPVAVPVPGALVVQQRQPPAAALTVAPRTPVSGPVPSAAAATAVVPQHPPAAPRVKAASAQREIDATFRYSANSWTEVYDATGKRLLYGMSAGPATRQLQGVPPLSVKLGNADGVTIEVGGRQAPISRFVRSDHTARFLIAADGQVLPAPPKKGD